VWRVQSYVTHFRKLNINLKKCLNNEKEMYNDKNRHTKDRLFGLPNSKNTVDWDIHIGV
jgi:hypothetical protein